MSDERDAEIQRLEARLRKRERDLRERERRLRETQTRLAALEASTALQVGRRLAAAARKPGRGLIALPRDLYRMAKGRTPASPQTVPGPGAADGWPELRGEVGQDERLLFGAALRPSGLVVAGALTAASREALTSAPDRRPHRGLTSDPALTPHERTGPFPTPASPAHDDPAPLPGGPGGSYAAPGGPFSDDPASASGGPGATPASPSADDPARSPGGRGGSYAVPGGPFSGDPASGRGGAYGRSGAGGRASGAGLIAERGGVHVVLLNPHDAAVVVDQVDPDLVVFEAAACVAGHPWAYLGDAGAADRQRTLLAVAAAARALGRPVVLWRNAEPSPGLPGLGWDAVVPGTGPLTPADLDDILGRFA